MALSLCALAPWREILGFSSNKSSHPILPGVGSGELSCWLSGFALSRRPNNHLSRPGTAEDGAYTIENAAKELVATAHEFRPQQLAEEDRHGARPTNHFLKFPCKNWLRHRVYQVKAGQGPADPYATTHSGSDRARSNACGRHQVTSDDHKEPPKSNGHTVNKPTNTKMSAGFYSRTFPLLTALAKIRPDS